jgi:hypothetical protein
MTEKQTQEITGNEPVSAELAMKMVEITEKNLWRLYDNELMQKMLSRSEDEHSVFHYILSLPDVMYRLVKFYSFPIEVPKQGMEGKTQENPQQ